MTLNIRFGLLRRGFWSRCAIVSLALLAVSPPALAQTFDEAKALFDAGDWRASAEAFEAASQTDAARRPEAAAFVLRAYANARDHAAVTTRFDACLSASRGTPFEPQCLLEAARSTYQNAMDTTGALAQLTQLLARFPNDPFATPGALYHEGIVQLDLQKLPVAACSTLERAVKEWPSSPFADDALVTEARAGARIPDLAVIDSAIDRLTAMDAAPVLRQKAQFERADYFENARKDRPGALAEYARVLAGFPDSTECAALAKLRMADLVPNGEFRLGLRHYAQVLASQPGLKPALREWAQAQTGIYQYQLGEKELARATFEALLSSNPGARARSVAEKYLTGMAQPDSEQNILILYDRAVRRRQVARGEDESYFDMQRVLAAGKRGFFARYAADTSRDIEDRAQMLYRECFARYYCGYGGEALEMSERILRDLNPQGVTRYECLYMRAFLMGRSGEWGRSVAEWKALVDSNPPFSFLPKCYLELAKSQHMAGDSLGAVFTLQELIVRFPARLESETAAEHLVVHFERDPALANALAEQKPLIAARWTKDRTLLVSGQPDDGGDGVVPVAETDRHSTTGGAE
jgi:tetratricopeptide (TPR) repeat protein